MPKKLPGNAFNAANNLKTDELFVKRKLYEAYALYGKDNLEAFEIPPPLKDFWKGENRLYGLVDLNYTPVHCSEARLVEIEKGVRVLDFVGEAYKQMKKEFQIAQLNNRFPVDLPPLTKFEAQKGFISPQSFYSTLVQVSDFVVIDKIISDHQIGSQVSSIKNFVPLFLEFLLDQARTIPFTFSSFLMGSSNFTLQTGLAFEIADYAHDSDTEKIKDFITHPYFEFYKNVALKYGFSIDMNAPWRLVANLSSPPMKKFMSAYMGEVNVGPGKYFKIYTQPAFLQDISFIVQSASRIYNTILNRRPRFQNHIIKNQSIHTKTTLRQPITPGEIDDTFPYFYWVKFYIDLKNVEKGSPFGEARLTHIFNNSKNLAKSIDKSSMMRYINKNFDDITLQTGSLNYERYKKFFNEVGSDKWPFHDFEDYYKQVISVANYKRY